MRQFICPKAVTHPSTNRARCRATALIENNALPLHQTANQKTTLTFKDNLSSHTRRYIISSTRCSQRLPFTIKLMKFCRFNNVSTYIRQRYQCARCYQLPFVILTMPLDSACTLSYTIDGYVDDYFFRKTGGKNTISYSPSLTIMAIAAEIIWLSKDTAFSRAIFR